MSVSDKKEPPPHVRWSEEGESSRRRPTEEGRSFRLHGEWHDFGRLVPLFGQAFVTRVLDAAVMVYLHQNPATTGKRILNLRRFLRYVAHAAAAGPELDCYRVFDALCRNRPEDIEKQDLDGVAGRFAAHLIDLEDTTIVRSSNLLTRRSIIEMVSGALQDTALEIGWPRIEPLRGPPIHQGDKGSNIISLGELTRPGEVVETSKVLALGAERLARLRKRLEEILLEEEAKFDLGKTLLDDDEVPIDEVIAAVSEINSRYSVDNDEPLAPSVEKCFYPGSTRGLSSLVRYVHARHQGIFFLHWLPYQLQRVVAAYGGTRQILGYLEGSQRALVAAWLIVMIDTGHNIQPIDDFAANAFSGVTREGGRQIRRVASKKRRANDKPVESLLLDDVAEPGNVESYYVPTHAPGASVSSVRAIEIWTKLSEPARKRAISAGNACAKFLWIIRHGSDPHTIRKYTPETWKSTFGAILDEWQDDDVLGGLKIQRRMIRKTVIQLRDLRHSGDATVASFLAGHSKTSVTNQFYLDGPHIKALLDRRIREFMDLWEASLIGTRHDLAERLFIPIAELLRRQKKAVETGIGFFCLDPEAGVQPETKGKTCTKLELCSSCPMMRFSPTPQSLEDLIYLKRSLMESEERFVGMNPARWVKVWMPLLALALAIIERLSNGPKGAAIRGAEARVAQKFAAGELVVFQPW